MDHVTPACATQRTAKVLENIRLARDTYLIRLEAPDLTEDIRPGQFVMIKPGSGTDPLLGRPFALYNVTRTPPGPPLAIEIVYQVVGKGTAALAAARIADRLHLWGPLGNGFGPPPDGPVIFVAGGIGQTPFLALGRWWTGQQTYGRVRYANPDVNVNINSLPNEPDTVVKTPVATSATLLYGVRSAAYLAGLEDFRENGIAVEVATDDGSAGHHGYVTDLLEQRLIRGERPAKVIGCGPPAMLASLTRLVNRYDIPCDLSLENHMACGFGVCFSCVAPIRQGDGSTDLRRVCVEGPVFNARDVAWA
ncbi:MAG: dihydroorotate dehydrogenase electron transfer subunit [Isosphaeraceae bacterium]